MSRPLAPCGTDSAYRRHLRRHEEPGQACRDAHAAETRKYYRPRPKVPRPGRLAAANAVLAQQHADRLAEYFWLRDGGVGAEDAAARVNIRAAPTVRAYERAYQAQRITRQQMGVAA